jgi:hypothetical protein
LGYIFGVIGTAAFSQAQDHALLHLDAGIVEAVVKLREGGIETFESCEGGDGHAFFEPTVRFHGDSAEGIRAVSVALASGLCPFELRRVWTLINDEITGPCWELTFIPSASQTNT